MSVAKIIELSAVSPKNSEDAIQSGIARTSKTIHGTKSARVRE
jgi:flavin-binding protein dodecin